MLCLEGRLVLLFLRVAEISPFQLLQVIYENTFPHLLLLAVYAPSSLTGWQDPAGSVVGEKVQGERSMNEQGVCRDRRVFFLNVLTVLRCQLTHAKPHPFQHSKGTRCLFSILGSRATLENQLSYPRATSLSFHCSSQTGILHYRQKCLMVISVGKLATHTSS